jgi:hypothetical protein
MKISKVKLIPDIKKSKFNKGKKILSNDEYDI